MLEHAISERVEARLMRLLNDPSTCPHGQPIPPGDLSDPPAFGEPLAQMPAGTKARIESVTEELPEILRYLGEIGMRPGVDVLVEHKAPLGGPVTVRVNGSAHAISLELAKMVTVRHA